VRQRDRGRGRAGRGADPRRLRLRQGVPGGALPARLEAGHHRRGHERGAEAGDRPRAAPLEGHGPLTDSLADSVLAGDVRAVARAISLVEADRPEAPPLLKALFPHAARAVTIGVTGPPGAGKSTLVDQLTARLRAQGRKVGIVAVDPTSPFTGGAILGDRIR